ncbi:putative porin [Labilibaculum sp.]|uniref:putative porin n=1 Tax=Labilibaculum sp. TaxID=2060723 RepID=UPI00356AEC8B
MKQSFLLISFLIFLSLNSYSQSNISESDKMGSRSESDNENSELDSLGYNSVKSVITTWKLIDYSTRKDYVKLDTVLGSHQNYNPIFQKRISNTYLGNLGSAYESNIYKDRAEDRFLFFTPYRDYMLKPEDIVFYNTTTPYTSVSYETGGSSGQAENLLKVLHTQNITPDWNSGIKYDLISTDGQYQNQATKLYDISFFSTYKKDRYDLSFVMNQNNITNEENGGLVDDSDLEDNEDPENLEISLDDSSSKLTNYNLFINGSYGIGEGSEVVNGKDTSYTYPINVLYNVKYELDSWRYKEVIDDTTYYDNTYFDADTTFDKVKYSNVRNTFQLVFNENKNKWIRLGARFGIISDYGKYNSRLETSSISWQQTDTKIHNNQLIAGLFSNAGAFMNWNASVQYVFEGYNQNDLHLNYDLTKWIGQKDSVQHGVSVSAKLDSKTPSYLLTLYNGNHQQWDLDLDKTTELELGVKYFNEKRKFKLGGQINQIDNYTYFGTDAIPTQYEKGITVLSAYLDKNFKLGNFYLNQKLVGQKSSEDQILPLPTFSIYSNNYYKNTFFTGALGLQVGFALHYNTAFNAPNYMPSIGQFHLQNDEEIGGFPKVDMYFNIRIKRTRFFFMYEHLNSSLGSKDYFGAPHYPLNPAMFKYGLIWTFYD